MDALKDSVGKGESLVTLINQLEKFDNSLQKSYPTSTPTSTTNIPSRTVQQVHRNGSSNSMQKKQHQISSQPINLSSKQSTSSSLTATVSSTSTVSKSQMPTAVKDKGPPFLNRNIQIPQQPTTPQKASIPQPSRNATLQPPLLPTSQSQKSPQPSPSKSSTTPSKAAPVDDKKSREQVINEIGKLLSQYGAPNEMNEFEKLKSAMLQKTTQELQNVYSTMFVRYICGKVPATNVQSASDTTSSNISSVNASGKRAAQQISPSSQSNTVPSKVRRSDATTTVTPSSSSQTNSSRPRISHPNSQQKNVTNLQTPSISQNSPQQ
uniref:Uncharacterized protein n=1 Tax=Panagrolaimus sp. ES5 TaxID=591445 RepID=A0AC34GFL4_9BILA